MPFVGVDNQPIMGRSWRRFSVYNINGTLDSKPLLSMRMISPLAIMPGDSRPLGDTFNGNAFSLGEIVTASEDVTT